MTAPRDKHDREHLRRLEVIQRLIDSIYDEAVKEAAAIGVSVGDIDLDKAFEFADYPLTQRRIDELVSWLRGQLQTAVVDGINAAWVLANNKNNVLVQRIFGGDVDELPEPVRRRYLSTNESAREAFLKRKTGGLDLSDRVWRYSQEFKTEIEMGIDLGIRDGKSAQQMARDLKQYLQHPDKLFRRVRDEHGMLHLSKRAADFHPGRGVYRSSYLNARRLAATETNMAYRTADHERWQKMDFVVGIEIHLSGNHTCKGRDGKPHAFTDICDQLQGKYPKDFKFTGWHPHCRCYATSILKTDEEIAADTQRLLNGEPVTGESENRVDDVPDNFKDWVEKNEKRIAEAGKKGTLPGFVRENESAVAIAKTDSSTANEVSNKTRHFGQHGNHSHKKTKEREMQDSVPMKSLRPEHDVLEYTRKQAEKIGAKMTAPMGYDDADRGNANISGDEDNCQSAVVAFFARLLGVDATAKKYGDLGDFVKQLEENQALAYYISPKNKVHPEPSRTLMSVDEVMDYINNETAKNGIYNLAINKWKNKKDGHIMCLIKNEGKAYLVDVQKGKRVDISEKLSLAEFVALPNGKKKGVELLRIDKLVLSDEAFQVLEPLSESR